MNRITKQILSFGVAIIMLFSVCGGVTLAEGGKDVTGLIEPFYLSVEQNGNTVDSGGTLVPDQPVDVAVSFDVPLYDGVLPADKYVALNDFASFELAEGLSLPDGATYVEKEMYSIHDVEIGKVSITDSNGILTAQIVFDSTQIFNETSGITKITGVIALDLCYKGPATANEPEDKPVSILDKGYKVHIPETPTTFTATKTGAKSLTDGQNIDWDVTVTPTKGTNTGKLDGASFSDDLTKVGSYVADSFSVTDKDGKTVADISSFVYNEDANTITYNFPSGCTGVHHVKFTTRTPNDIFFASEKKTVENTADIISSDGVTTKSTKASVEYDIKWIAKEAVGTPIRTIDENGKTVIRLKWTITANTVNATLPNAVIRDALDGRVTLKSATLYVNGVKSDGFVSGGLPTPVVAGSKNNYDFELGTISQAVRLTIEADFPVDDRVPDHNISHGDYDITNSAFIRWADRPGVGSGTVTTNIGFNPIRKTAVSYDPATHTVEWQVTVKKSDITNDLRVIDLFWYGAAGSFKPNENNYVISYGTASHNELQQITDAVLKKLTPNYGHEYLFGSIGGDNGIHSEFYDITDGVAGRKLGSILVVTQAGGGGIEVESDRTFTFKTEVLDPNVYLSNESGTLTKTVKNTAMLFSQDLELNDATATASCSSGMLKKDMLTVADAEKVVTNSNDIASVNGMTAAIDKGFNYTDKTVVYRLVVNSDNCKYYESIGEDPDAILNNIVVTDVLPAGWEFVDFDLSNQYYIYKAEKSGGTVRATELLTAPAELSGTPQIIPPAGTRPAKASFTFSTLTQPYVILLRARPTDATASEYFSKNGDATVTNTAHIGTVDKTEIGKAEQKTKLTSKALDKTVAKKGEAGDVVEWTVEYKPYGVAKDNRVVIDKLPVGLELRLNANGSLDVTNGNITIRKLTLSDDGSYCRW